MNLLIRIKYFNNKIHYKLTVNLWISKINKLIFQYVYLKILNNLYMTVLMMLIIKLL